MSYSGSRWLGQGTPQQQPVQYRQAAAPSWVSSRGRESPPRPGGSLAGWQPAPTGITRVSSISPKRGVGNLQGYGASQPLWEEKSKVPSNNELQRLRNAVAAAEARVAKFESTTSPRGHVTPAAPITPATPPVTRVAPLAPTTPPPPAPTPVPSEYLQLVSELRTVLSDLKKTPPSHPDPTPLIKEQKLTLDALATSVADIATKDSISMVKEGDVDALKEARSVLDARGEELERRHAMLVEMEVRVAEDRERVVGREAAVGERETAAKVREKDLEGRVENVSRREERIDAREARFEEREKRSVEKQKDTSFPPQRQPSPTPPPVDKYHEGLLPITADQILRSHIEQLSDEGGPPSEHGKPLATYHPVPAEFGSESLGEPRSNDEDPAVSSVPDSESYAGPQEDAEEMLNHLMSQGMPLEMALGVVNEVMSQQAMQGEM